MGRTRRRTASTTLSGQGSEDGCDGCQASAEPVEGIQSQLGSFPLVEEWMSPGVGHVEGSFMFFFLFTILRASLPLHQRVEWPLHQKVPSYLPLQSSYLPQP